jgi:hypothetical protein
MQDYVFAPEALIRIEGGHAYIHNPQRPAPALQTEDAAVLSFVAGFIQPTNPESLINRLPLSMHPAARQAVQSLIEANVLLPATAPVLVQDAQSSLERSHALLAQVQLGLDQFRQQLQNLSPEQALAAWQHSGISLDKRLEALAAGVFGLLEQSQ